MRSGAGGGPARPGRRGGRRRRGARHRQHQPGREPTKPRRTHAPTLRSGRQPAQEIRSRACRGFGAGQLRGARAIRLARGNRGEARVRRPTVKRRSASGVPATGRRTTTVPRSIVRRCRSWCASSCALTWDELRRVRAVPAVPAPRCRSRYLLRRGRRAETIGDAPQEIDSAWSSMLAAHDTGGAGRASRRRRCHRARNSRGAATRCGEPIPSRSWSTVRRSRGHAVQSDSATRSARTTARDDPLSGPWRGGGWSY